MYDSIDVARAAVQVALTPSRQSEENLINRLGEKGLKAAAVDVGGNINDTIHIVIERAIIASRKCGVTQENHIHDGAIAGAAREAIMQISSKVNGLNGGGKIGICRAGEHLSVCIFMSAGLLHLNEVVIGLAHRAVPE
ncbi:MAG: HutP family protein [Bacillota bacterium]|nr:HutP family protein [Bacillota bacterium]